MAELKIGRMMLGVCQTNCYFVYREGQKEVLLFDPADQGKQIFQSLKENGFQVKAILLTHGHFDHIWGSKELRELSGAKIYAYSGEKDVLENEELNVSAQAGRAYKVEADEYVNDGEQLIFGDMSCKLIATPGHTKGSCCYYFEEDQMLIAGDTLFQESVGRTDLPTGSMSQIVRSVKEKLLCLPDSVKVYPGHGGTTTIGFERDNNPFL